MAHAYDDATDFPPIPRSSPSLASPSQAAKALAADAAGRSQFVHSGALAAVQQLADAPGGALRDAAEAVSGAFPEEIARHYSPAYSRALLQRLDEDAARAGGGGVAAM